MKVGDEILRVGNKLVEEKMLEIRKKGVFTSSNEASYNSQIYPSTLSGHQNKIMIDVKREDSVFTDTITTYPPEILMKYYVKNSKTPSYYSIDSSTVFYNPSSSDVSGFWMYLNKTDYSNKNFIFDLRSYPSFIIDSISKYFYPKEVCFASSYSTLYPGFFEKESIIKGTSNKNFYQGKIIAIVNSNTLSLGEYTTMALQGVKNAIVIGSQTAGADGNVTNVIVPGGCVIYFSGIGISYSDGTATQKKGVKIDVEIHQTIAGLKEGRDELLDAAKKILNIK